ncbi:MAG TPA: glucokinase [Acidiferrobacterales bacterium]
MPVLTGDIGGTKTLLQLADVEGGACRVLAERRFDSAAYKDLASMAQEFVAAERPAARVTGACFGVAGPVTTAGGRQTAKLTNLPWRLDSASLARALDVPHVRLINDFQAVGYGLEALRPGDLSVLQPGRAEARAPRALIGAGTGLGVGVLVWSGDHYEVLPSEGGHVDFAPTDDRQIALLNFLRDRYKRVSVERVVSGPGLVNIYRFLAQQHGHATDDLSESQADPAAAISTAGAQGSDALAVEAMEIFVEAYGAFAGNLALSLLPRGGVYIAGGIAPKIVEMLRTGDFLNAFRDKGRMGALLEDIPVQVVMNPKVGLLGAALAAGRL